MNWRYASPPAGSEEAAAGESSFEELLRAPKFEQLRRRLIRIFARRGCALPEDLADETISRVLARLPELSSSYEGDPTRYVYAVARNVYFEYSRRPRTVPLEENLDLADVREDYASAKETPIVCLEECLGLLAPEERRLIRGYYGYDKITKIDHRRELAAELGLGMNALRIKAFRIRQRLSACLGACLKRRERLK